jgi:Phage tail lysozyme
MLTNAGASTIQAIAILANMQNESGFDPEETNPAGPQAGVGLIQWETTYYPGAAGLITGNSTADAQAQINYLAQTGGFAAATGPTPQAAAQNFAQNYERCASCGPGGQQFNSRGQNAVALAQAAATGQWPQSAGSLTETSASASGDCLISLPGSSLPIVGSAVPCLLTRTEARALIGGALITAGMSMGLVAVLILAVYGLRETGVARSAQGYLEFAGLGRIASRAASGSGKTGRKPGMTPAQQAATGQRVVTQHQKATQYQGAHARSTARPPAAAANRYAASGRQPAYQGRHRGP